MRAQARAAVSPSYRYTESVSADIAFEAEAGTLEDLFRCSADAVMNVMVDDLSTIRPRVEREFQVVSPSSASSDEAAQGSLLFEFLQALVFFKDAEQLLLRVKDLWIRKDPDENALQLRARLVGERIDPKRGGLGSDVKGVTMHRFAVRQVGDHWTASVVLDV